MRDIQSYIESGVIESYVTGLATLEEINQVEIYAAQYPAIQEAINKFSDEIEQFALQNPATPDPLSRPMVMASFDYMKRLTNGEEPVEPPLLSINASISDFDPWLNRNDLQRQSDDSIFAKLIGYTPTAITAIVWIKEMATPEVHHHEYERFLIIEGTCEITVEASVTALKPGDFFEIPLHTVHSVRVTSSIPCKVILQRVAA